MMERISVLMATKNRLETLKITLTKSEFLIKNDRVIFTVLDDGSSDGTFEFIREKYPEINVIKNNKSKGIFFCRNILFNQVTTRYAITIDDDVNFLGNFYVDDIIDYFNSHQNCSVMAFRIFWGKDLPEFQNTVEQNCRVKSFGAGANAMRMSTWKRISQLPVWFKFYGEEDFIALEFLKLKQFVHYTPKFLVHHRVNLRSRKNEKDYLTRSRRSLRAGWYIYILFYPLKYIPRKISYSIWMQLKLKVFKGDFKALAALVLALGDFGINSMRLIKKRKALNNSIYKKYIKLPDAKLYWTPLISRATDKDL